MANKKDSLGDRMKENYENRSKTYLTRRTPCIIRLDGKAFHSFTKGFNRPYDQILHKSMEATLKYLCENIQGCKLGYQQSDEITLILTDYDTLQTDAWFDYSVQKICSIAASMATFAFNRNFEFLVDEYIDSVMALQDYDLESIYLKALQKAREKGAMFDARCFNVPKEELGNCILWRFLDCQRNSVQMLGQAHFSHGQLQGLSQEQIQEKLFSELGINWANCPEDFKNGVWAVRDTNNKWQIAPMINLRTERIILEDYFERGFQMPPR